MYGVRLHYLKCMSLRRLCLYAWRQCKSSEHIQVKGSRRQLGIPLTCTYVLVTHVLLVYVRCTD